MSRMITVTRHVPATGVLRAGRSRELLNYLRRMVQDIRRDEPEVENLRLSDIGIVPRGIMVELRFYFEP